jgi:DNA sulfur modification protein DndB
MGNLSEEFTGKLVKDKEIKSFLRVRSRSFVTKTVDKRLLPDYEETGWVVDKQNKKSVALKKPKAHHTMFEDRVWTILAKMGFTALRQ